MKMNKKKHLLIIKYLIKKKKKYLINKIKKYLINKIKKYLINKIKKYLIKKNMIITMKHTKQIMTLLII